MPKRIEVTRRQKDGSYVTGWEDWPTEKETYEGKERLAIVDALNVLGMFHSPLKHLPKEMHEALMGEDYEWGEAHKILYGALGIDLDLKNPQPAYDAFIEIRQKEWDKHREDESG